jgi:PAS domain S-box-containing protein
MDALEIYKSQVAARLSTLTPLLQNYAMGDFEKTIEIPEEEDEFTELLVGITLMADDFREMLDELKSRNHLISGITDTSPALIYVYNLETQSNIYSNPGVERLLGYSSEEILAMGDEIFIRIIHPDDLPHVFAFQEKIMAAADEETLEIEYRMQHHSGEWLTFRSYERPFLRDSEGSVQHKIGIAIDITEHKLAKENLQKQLTVIQLSNKISNQFHMLTIDQIDEGINSVLAEIANFVGANRSSIFQFSDDLKTMTNSHEWCESQDDSQIELLQGIPFETFGVHTNTLKRHEIVAISGLDDYPPEAVGEREWVANHGFRSLLFIPLLWNGELMGALGFYGPVGTEVAWPDIYIWLLQLVGDIFVGALKRRQIEQNNTRLGRILEDSLNEIYIFDARTLQFIQVNRGAQENLGFSMLELTQLTPPDIKPEFSPEEFSKLIQPLRDNSKEVIQFESCHQRKDGSTYDIEVHIQLDQIANNAVFVAIIMDITERKKVAHKLEKHIAEIERFNRMAIGREHRMIDLKREVNSLVEELGREPVYDLSFSE